MKDVLLVLTLAIAWGLAGVGAGIGIGAFDIVDWVVACGLINLIIGMFMLLWVTRDENAQRLFYDGPKGNEPGNVVIALLWVLPSSLLSAGLFLWLLAQFFR